MELSVSEIRKGLVIECRPSQISQALLNLLNNSFDAVANLSHAWVRLDVVERDGSVELSVTDSGKGIAPELREKILQPFFTTKELGQGVGLGLSISNGLIESHRGMLRMDTRSSNTRFVVTLPSKQSQEELREVAL